MPILSLPLLTARSARLNFSLMVVLATLALVFGPESRAGAQTCTPSTSPSTCTITGTIATNPTNDPNKTNGTATSSVTVALGGTVNAAAGSVAVELDGLTTVPNTPTNNIDGFGLYLTNIILQGPSGTMVLLGGVGDTGTLTNDTIVVKDNGANTLTFGTALPASGSSVKPASFWTNPDHGFSSVLPSGATAALYPTTDGTATLSSVFGGTPTDGTWKLYLSNSGDNTSVSITGWKLTLSFTTTAANPTTTTIVSSNNAQALGNNVTFTANVSGGGAGTVNNGSVTFKNLTSNNNLTCSGGNPAAVSNGTATCVVPASNVGEGESTVQALYSPGTGWQASNGTMSELIEGTTTNPSTDRFCNTGSATSPGGDGVGKIDPSIIKVSGLTNTVANVEVELNGVTTSNGGVRGAFLLVAPDGTHNLDFLDEAFNDTAVSNINLQVLDSGSTRPNGTFAASSGSYLPTDENVNNTLFLDSSPSAHSFDSAIPDIPASLTYGFPHGSASNTLEAAFNSATANGDWALYMLRFDSGAVTLTNGWCIDFTLNTGTPTTTTVTSSLNQANGAKVGQPVTLTAHVSDSNGPINGGTVSFSENGNPVSGTLSNGGTVSNGIVTLTTSTLTEGDHPIVASYSGDAGDNESLGSITQRIDRVTTLSQSGNVISACNVGLIGSSLQTGSTTDGNTGAFVPNPSNIFASNLPGTLRSITIGLNGLTTGDESVYLTQSMVAGPNNTGLDFFSGTGNSTFGPFGPINLTLSDSASAQIPQSSYASGTYKPADYTSGDTFFASSSGFYPLPATILSAGSHGTSTFASAFPNGTMTGNGTWSLYFNITSKLLRETLANGWCVNFTQNPVNIDLNLGHTGDSNGDFIQGESVAPITLNVENLGVNGTVGTLGTGTAGDPVGNANPLTVVDTLPSGLTYDGAANGGSKNGTGWSCSAVGQKVTCTNDAASIAAGATYPALTIFADVLGSLTGSVINTVTVSGATTNGGTGNDTIKIDVPPAITSASATTFTVGANGSFTVTTTGSPTPTTNQTGTLPSGISFTDNGNGTGSLSGTPAAGTGGSYPLTIGASNGAPPNASQSFTLVVDQPPAITSASSATFSVGTFGSFVAMASGYPAPTLSETGALPSGVTFSSSGLLSGTPAPGTGGAYTITITASNGVGTNATQSFTLTVDQPPAITSVAATTFVAGSAGTFTVTTTGYPASALSETGALPTGVGFVDNGNGTASLSGIPAAGTGGVYNITIKAGNGISPPASQNFTLTVNESPAITSAASSTFGVGAAGSFQVTAFGYPGVTFSEVGALPSGVTMTSAGLLSGTPAFGTQGSYPITITATNGLAPDATQSFTLTVTPPAFLVVNAATDDSNSASNCSPQNSPQQNVGDASCTLRDALAEAQSLGAASIYFDTTKFTSATIITLSDTYGALALQPDTSIFGLTSGSGSALTNLITVNAAANNSVFTAGSITAVLSNLNITGGNSAGGGGGIANTGGTLTISQCTFSNNQAASGGAIYTSGGALTLSSSTFSNNQASGLGGAIDVSAGTANISFSTLNNNSSAGSGGGIANGGGGAVTITNSTISQNAANSSQGGGIFVDNGTVTLTNSIVAANTASAGPDAFGALTDGGQNIIGDGTGESGISNGANGDLVGTTAAAVATKLAALGNYGGPTKTLVPQPGSPAICAGSAASIPSGVTTDQRGVSIGAGGYCPAGTIDVGAVQTDYAGPVFTVQPSPSNIPATILQSILISPAPAVSVTENGVGINGATVTMTDAEGALAGSKTAATAAGLATFGSLKIGTPEASDTLTATLPLNGAVTLQATSNPFIVAQIPNLVSPASGSILAGTNVTFNWNAAGDTTFRFRLGTAPGLADLYDSGTTTQTSATATTLPANAVTIYGTLSFMANGQWHAIPYTFVEAATAPVLLSPTPGSPLSGANQTFTWSPGSGTDFRFRLGTAKGLGDINDTAPPAITQTSATFTGLPVNGSTLYATLSYKVNGVWYVVTATYTAANTPPVLQTPAPGHTLSGANVTFTWTPGGDSTFRFRVGTTPGSGNLYDTGATTSTSANPTSLPTDGSTLYVTLSYKVAGVWHAIPYTYTAGN